MRVVQVGIGRWGQNHARILSDLGVLGAICDPNAQKCKEYGAKYSVNHYQTLDRLLDAEEFDAAFIVTPTSTHAELAKRLLGAKKHVFVEKPLTYHPRDAEMLAELARKNNVLLTCGYIERFNPAVSKVKELLDAKRYGDLVMLEFQREGMMPSHIKDVGVIFDTSVHDIDAANWLFGQMPGMVFAKAGSTRHEHEDHASIILGYKDGRFATITSNWITPRKLRRFKAVCTDAVISSDFITQEATVQGSKTVTLGGRQEPLSLEISSFLGAVRGQNDHIVTAQQAVNVTKIARAALLSSQKGIPIYLDLK